MIDHHKNTLRVKRIGVDTYREPVIYMREDCAICRAEGFEAFSRVDVRIGDRSIIAPLHIIRDSIIESGELGLSDAAWRLLHAEEGQMAYLSHPEPLESLAYLRAKIHGHTLTEYQFTSIINDIVAHNYDDIYLSAFITACAGNRLNLDEIVHMTRAMIDAGSKLHWDEEIVVDKHSVGGLPGNRTTLIVVPIVAAFGLVMPKTSSRAITSPAGTADTMEMLAPVTLSTADMQRVVKSEGACIIWGGAVHLSPADDILIAVERQLDIDSEGQLIASVLSKKAAAGSSHVLIDIPVGKTAKVRSMNKAHKLADTLVEIGSEIGMNVRVKITDGEEPVGYGIGPALEARDVLAVLQNKPEAPEDLKERSLLLAGEILELSGKVQIGEGINVARGILADGTAWNKFQAICESQGGMRIPAKAGYRHEVTSDRDGHVERIDNRRLALGAKLAGAPLDSSAGIDLHVKQQVKVEKGQPLFTVHAESAGELEYALDYLASQKDIILIKSD